MPDRILTHRKRKPCKIWIEHNGKLLIGKGGAEIPEGITWENSISKAAETLGMVLLFRLKLN